VTQERMIVTRRARALARLNPYECPALTRQTLGSTVDALQSSHNVPLPDVLLSEVIPEGARAIFAEGLEEETPFVLPKSVLFPATEYPLVTEFRQEGQRCEITVDTPEQLSVLADAFSSPSPLRKKLRNAGFLETLSPNDPLSIRLRRPGIHRLQHASLLFNTESTSVITDPNLSYELPQRWLGVRHYPEVDAILISHSHEDHFCLASLLQFPRSTKIIVPVVKQASMLCLPMAKLLRDAGFTDVVEAPWHSELSVGDIHIAVYPFYGEQPWLSSPAPVPELRNHGNTYVITVDGIRSWVLIDSGNEYGHAMLDECDAVRKRHGHIDILLSNMRMFGWNPGQIDGSGRYLFCFPREFLANPASWPMGQSITLGPSGIREIIDRLKPTCFLPYAHWWQPCEKEPHLVDRRYRESELLENVRSAPSAEMLRTQLLRWNVADILQLRSGALHIDRYCS
jgi:L-ascorbate metabolism protein UlaG (beta-lactamase superfamily)